MSLQSEITLAFQRVGSEFNTASDQRGVLADLNTTDKQNLVSAINELQESISDVDLTSLIADSQDSGNDKVYSIDKVIELIAGAKNELLGGAGAAFDTLTELNTLISGNDLDISTILSTQSKRVGVDAAQSFSAEEKTQAIDNIGAVSLLDIGDVSHDFVADFNGSLN